MKKTNKGFTLVELIIVIAVIGVLAAILIPVFSNVVNKANQKSALSDARNAVTELTAEITDGAGTTMPDSMMFVQKGNKMYAFGFSATNGFKAYDEEGFDMVTRFATAEENYNQTVKEYAQLLRAEGAVQMSRTANGETMFAAFKTMYPNDALATRATYAELTNDEQLQVMHSMIQNVGFDPNTMILQFSYTPTANFFGNTEVVAPAAAGTTFMINGVATTETNLQTVIDNAPAGATVRLYQDVTLSNSNISITKDIVIDGNGHTLNAKNANPKRAIWIDDDNVSLTLKNLVIDGGNKCQRGVQVNNGAGDNFYDADITIIDCEIKGMTYYAVNFCNCTRVDLVVKNTKITGWAAINAYGSGNTILIQDSELVGLNNKSLSASNRFATICVEGDSTGATDIGAEDYHIVVENTIIEAKQTKGNVQALVGFNQHSKNSSVSLKNCTLKSNSLFDGEYQVVYNYGTDNSFDMENCTFNDSTSFAQRQDFLYSEYGAPYDQWFEMYFAD